MNEEDSFEVRRRRHALGYAPAPPSPPMPTWSPVLSEQEKAERECMIAAGEIQF